MMNTKTDACNAKKLEDLLNSRLDEDEECALMTHLSVCETCQSNLERRAADVASWDEAKVFLIQSRDLPYSESITTDSSQRSLQIETVLGTLTPTDDPQMLGRLGGYEVSGVIGSGAMGVVLKGYDGSLDRTVAIKVMAPHLASSGPARKRFAREAKAAAAVLHPNVMAIHGVSNGEVLPYLVMPYFGGKSLQRRIEEDGPMPPEEILRIGSQIAAGLAAAHAQGIIHRDIKPANVLLEQGVERIAITDFGLARAVDDATMTRSGMIAGTPQYMSPEQTRGEAIDQRSDLFSLGSVLYAMCTSHSPFRAETMFGVLRRITDEEPRSIREINPNIPEWLCAVIHRLLNKDCNERYSSSSEVATLLEDCLAHVQQPTVAPLPERILELNSSKTRRSMTHLQIIKVYVGKLAWSKIMLVALLIAVFSAGLFAILNRPDGQPQSREEKSVQFAQEGKKDAGDPDNQANNAPFQAATAPASSKSVKSSPGEASSKLNIKAKSRSNDEPIKEPTYKMFRRVNVMEMAFSEEGKKLTTLSVSTDIPTEQNSFTIRVWNVNKRQLSKELKVKSEFSFRPQTLLLAHDRKLVAAASDEYVLIWDTKTGERRKKFAIPNSVRRGSPIDCLACTPDLSRIAVTSTTYVGTAKFFDGVAAVWGVDSGKSPVIIRHKNSRDFKSLSFSPDGKQLATTAQYSARIWNTSTGEMIHDFPNKLDPVKGVHNTNGCVQFSPNGDQLAIASLWGVTLIDSRKGKLQRLIKAPFGITRDGRYRVVYSSDGKLLARLGTHNGSWTVPIWSAGSGKLLHQLPTESYRGSFSGDGKRFAIGLHDRIVGFNVWQMKGAGKSPARIMQ